MRSQPRLCPGRPAWSPGLVALPSKRTRAHALRPFAALRCAPCAAGDGLSGSDNDADGPLETAGPSSGRTRKARSQTLHVLIIRHVS